MEKNHNKKIHSRKLYSKRISRWKKIHSRKLLSKEISRWKNFRAKRFTTTNSLQKISQQTNLQPEKKFRAKKSPDGNNFRAKIFQSKKSPDGKILRTAKCKRRRFFRLLPAFSNTMFHSFITFNKSKYLEGSRECVCLVRYSGLTCIRVRGPKTSKTLVCKKEGF